MHLDNVKKQHQHELVPLIQQQEILAREVAELKAVRDREWTRKEEIVLQNGNEMLVPFRAVSFNFTSFWFQRYRWPLSFDLESVPRFAYFATHK
jgi:hypothetical protein